MTHFDTHFLYTIYIIEKLRLFLVHHIQLEMENMNFSGEGHVYPHKDSSPGVLNDFYRLKRVVWDFPRCNYIHKRLRRSVFDENKYTQNFCVLLEPLCAGYARISWLCRYATLLLTCFQCKLVWVLRTHDYFHVANKEFDLLRCGNRTSLLSELMANDAVAHGVYWLWLRFN